MAGIYIHVPYCRQACHYCNFHYSVSHRSKDAFLRALHKEIRLQKSFFDHLQHAGESPVIETIYIGGGTPSLLSAVELSGIFDVLFQNVLPDHVTEVTLEANPDDLDPEKLQALRQTPVNRLSIGIQSFCQSDLAYLNRLHSAGQAMDSLTNARKAGFENITIDLIYGTPGMTDGMWLDNLQTFLYMGLPHLSAYALTVEEKTVLEYLIRKGRVPAVSEEQCARQFELLCAVMAKNGYHHYEISNFALEGHYSNHNMAYWTGVPYLGLGPSAHSYVKGKRFWNIANTAAYIAALENNTVPYEEEILTPVKACNEYVMTSLRTMWGCDLAKVRSQWGSERMTALKERARQFVRDGMIVEKDQHLVITGKGKLFADGIAAALFFDE